MAFYCINNVLAGNSAPLLQQACEKRDIEFIELDALTVDFSKPIVFAPGDLLYRTATSHAARVLERTLMNEAVTTFHASFHRSFASYLQAPLLEYHGISVPKTIAFAHKDRTLLQEYVNALGGFPIIIKATGGSHGVGVMKIDSLASLFSVVDYLSSIRVSFVLRQFINVTSSARCLVLGDRVIDSIQYAAPEGDFRSNEGNEPNVSAKVFPQDVQDMAVKAVQVLDREFGGVDILMDQDGNNYITEVNFPCYFARCQETTGTDVAGMMVDYLVDKAAKKL